ncbi:hypothetical protein, partial [Dyella acidiphila]|uniref:hypothetical protein n=1 Tax=Dyella acidiphila TaxID=2775866 RepID=UPI001CE46099
PNSEVKRSCADGSVDFHARVGHRQGLYPKKPSPFSVRVFALCASAQPQQVTARSPILKTPAAQQQDGGTRSTRQLRYDAWH